MTSRAFALTPLVITTNDEAVVRKDRPAVVRPSTLMDPTDTTAPCSMQLAKRSQRLNAPHRPSSMNREPRHAV